MLIFFMLLLTISMNWVSSQTRRFISQPGNDTNMVIEDMNSSYLTKQIGTSKAQITVSYHTVPEVKFTINNKVLKIYPFNNTDIMLSFLTKVQIITTRNKISGQSLAKTIFNKTLHMRCSFAKDTNGEHTKSFVQQDNLFYASVMFLNFISSVDDGYTTFEVVGIGNDKLLYVFIQYVSISYANTFPPYPTASYQLQSKVNNRILSEHIISNSSNANFKQFPSKVHNCEHPGVWADMVFLSDAQQTSPLPIPTPSPILMMTSLKPNIKIFEQTQSSTSYLSNSTVNVLSKRIKPHPSTTVPFHMKSTSTHSPTVSIPTATENHRSPIVVMQARSFTFQEASVGVSFKTVTKTISLHLNRYMSSIFTSEIPTWSSWSPEECIKMNNGTVFQIFRRTCHSPKESRQNMCDGSNEKFELCNLRKNKQITVSKLAKLNGKLTLKNLTINNKGISTQQLRKTLEEKGELYEKLKAQTQRAITKLYKENNVDVEKVIVTKLSAGSLVIDYVVVLKVRNDTAQRTLGGFNPIKKDTTRFFEDDSIFKAKPNPSLSQVADYNECKDSNACHKNAICINLLDQIGYSCQCREGYEGNGASCKSVRANKSGNGKGLLVILLIVVCVVVVIFTLCFCYLRRRFQIKKHSFRRSSNKPEHFESIRKRLLEAVSKRPIKENDLDRHTHNSKEDESIQLHSKLQSSTVGQLTMR